MEEEDKGTVSEEEKDGGGKRQRNGGAEGGKNKRRKKGQERGKGGKARTMQHDIQLSQASPSQTSLSLVGRALSSSSEQNTEDWVQNSLLQARSHESSFSPVVKSINSGIQFELESQAPPFRGYVYWRVFLFRLPFLHL